MARLKSVMTSTQIIICKAYVHSPIFQIIVDQQVLLLNFFILMQVGQITSPQNIYRSVDIKSQISGSGVVVIQAIRSKNNRKAMIIGRRVRNDMQRELLQKGIDKKSYDFKYKYLQKYIQKPFLYCLDQQNKDESYYLIALQFPGKQLSEIIKSINMKERLEIAFKIAKALNYVHGKRGSYEQFLSLSCVSIEKGNEEDGIDVKIPPPFPKTVNSDANKLINQEFKNDSQRRKSELKTLAKVLYELIQGKELSVSTDFQLIESITLRKLLTRLYQNDEESPPTPTQEIVHTLKGQATIALYGQQFRISLVVEQQEHRLQKDEKEKYLDVSILIKGYVLEVIFSRDQNATETIKFNLHQRQDFALFLSAEYRYAELSEEIRSAYRNLVSLFDAISKKDKHSIRYDQAGGLIFNGHPQLP